MVHKVMKRGITIYIVLRLLNPPVCNPMDDR